MSSKEFRIITRWQFEAGIAEIAAILGDAESFPQWWGDVYLDVRKLDAGGADGIGQRIAVRSRGWLPYQVNWIGTLLESDAPHGWVIGAEGDLTGRGAWQLTQHGPVAEVVFDWRVTADRPLFRILSPVFAPVFAWNHRWAMERGRVLLKREILRRRGVGARLFGHRSDSQGRSDRALAR
jgi:hypothetical protein